MISVESLIFVCCHHPYIKDVNYSTAYLLNQKEGSYILVELAVFLPYFG